MALRDTYNSTAQFVLRYCCQKMIQCGHKCFTFVTCSVLCRLFFLPQWQIVKEFPSANSPYINFALSSIYPAQCEVNLRTKYQSIKKRFKKREAFANSRCYQWWLGDIPLTKAARHIEVVSWPPWSIPVHMVVLLDHTTHWGKTGD